MLRKEVIFVDLPPHVKGMVVRTFDEEPCYTIVLNSNLNAEQQQQAYQHEIEHLENDDFSCDWTVGEVEWVRHVG